MRFTLLVLVCGAARATYPGPKRGYRGMPDSERVAYYEANGYQWPPVTGTSGWPAVPREESAAYKKSRDEMEAWIRRNLTTYKATFDEWGTLVQSRHMPAFTKNGFEVFDLKDDPLFTELKANYDKNVRDPAAFARLRSESMASKKASGAPKFYDQTSLNSRLLEALRPRMEKWAGIPLKNGQAYGVRVYRNGSALVAHIDRSETHVISAIFHVDHDLDEDWPLEIEDSDGAWHYVNLKAGELCAYESAKQYHARLTPMRGRAYASVFLHWYPAEGWDWTMWDTHVTVPPDFESTRGRQAVEDAGPPPFVRAYEAYWASRGFAPPPLHRGIEDPVQSYDDDALVPLADFAERASRLKREADLRRYAGLGLYAEARRLLKAADVDVHGADENGWNALHEAARAGDRALAKLLVDHGADASIETGAGDTAHDWAHDEHGPDHPVTAYFASTGAPRSRGEL